MKAEVTEDPEGLYTELLALRGKERLLRAEADALRSELGRIRKDAEARPALTRRLGTANAALDAYRVENRRLKADLARLRRSRAIRLSRALTRPLAPIRNFGTNRPGSSGAEAQPALVTPETPPSSEDKTLWEKKPSECTYDELKLRLDTRPSTEALGHVVNRAWFTHGLIDEPAALLQAWPDLADGLTGSVAAIAGRIRGARRLEDVANWIPKRSPGIAYIAERDRLMYCVHSTPVYNSNGYSTRTRGVAAALTAQGVEVRVVARAGYPWDARTDSRAPELKRSVTTLSDIDYVHLPGPHEGRDPHDHVIQQMADAFVREARLYRPSMIQAASNYRTGLAALIAARRLGLPFVYEVRGLWELTEASGKPGWDESDRFRITKTLETLVAREADHVLAITAEVAAELVRRGVDEDRISLLPNGVDPDQFMPLYPDLELRKRFGRSPAEGSELPAIGFAGSMVAYEGLDLLLQASQILVERGIPHNVVLAGSGPVEQDLRRTASEQGLDHVTFLGRLPSGAIPALLSSLDVVVCPRRSTLITELVSPLKPLEAMSTARAVVLSDVAPNRSIAGEDGKRAVLHASDDATALADALAPLLEDADVRRALGRHARRWIRQERSWAALGEDALAAHRAAARHYADSATESLRLSDLRVAVVADEFTTRTLAAEVQVTSLGRTTWPAQLDEVQPHLVFIESAWDNHGEWHRGVGYYSTEEHADFQALVDECRDRGIPTVFWNKEDPVHFDRFVRAAAQCDHVFTTDANMIPRYLAAAEHTQTASALPFYAAPSIHNPLPGTMEFRGGTSYAGTFYGDRFPQRSEELARLLTEAAPFGLTIYDRQADNPDSPYGFPAHLQRHVVGALPYAQVLDAYKAHTANLNVNSVADSPSMFSRRVVEVAASGAIVLSAPGRGITETFGSAIACSDNPQDWRAWLRAWTKDPEARRQEAWLQMRTVLRSHTAATALTIVARTAGVPVTATGLPPYAAVVDDTTPAMLDAVAAQSVLPEVLYVPVESLDEARQHLGNQVTVLTDDPSDGPSDQVVRFGSRPDRTTAEDLLHALSWRDWAWVSLDEGEPGDLPYARPSGISAPVNGTVLTNHAAHNLEGVEVSRTSTRPPSQHDPEVPDDGVPSLEGTRLLIAGHDLKFAGHLIDAAKAAGATVTIDKWQGHNQHDETTSRQLLQDADVVFCEWGLGNAVWYSHHLQPHQRLIVRVHAQELRGPYLRQIAHDRVDHFVFVGQTVMESAVSSHGITRQKSSLIPNGVDAERMRLPKHPVAAHTLGLVGAIPKSKRPDLALDLLERLRLHDNRYILRIKGHRPEHYPWLRDNAEESAYYERLTARIKFLNRRHHGSVIWDRHGNDMDSWFQNVGIVLSLSDHESFHYSIADGVASGAYPVLLTWPGADNIYPHQWLHSDLAEIAQSIRNMGNPEGAQNLLAKHSLTRTTQALLGLLTPSTSHDDV
ncbi:glycosyltransferase [Ornithinimicrobium sp. Y1847]|uniref:glycosyltransferase n=1 Tax=Ornithinimicrobium sp. Y1847 TaxID=3405419 RepID=UPI003B68474F